MSQAQLRPDSAEFTGTPRFQVLRRLGQGGMGVVYEVEDRERGQRVALKTLRIFQPDSLLRLKNEFRRLADLQHPNLINLGEMHSEGGHWFFTMELIDGVDFLSFVRPSPTGERWREHDVSPSAETVAPWSEHPQPPRRRLQRPPLDPGRLRTALVHLGRGLQALHAAGKVHRDIKPSNVLVGRDGRAVVLDFGLAVDAGQAGLSEVNIVGTADYMAPEQAASRPLGPAADWYAVGVMLFEALTARLPFEGGALEVLLQKQRQAAPTVLTTASDAPPDLAALCDRLLAGDPAQRPDSSEVLRLLRADQAPVPAAAPPPREDGVFVGRERELAQLDEVFERTRKGQPMAVLVSGESGVGKSALVRRFTERLKQRHADAVILAGRCYERESVPYKALDGAIDALAGWMTKLPKPAAAALLPLRVDLLAEVFPVLARVPAVLEAPVARTVQADPQERRERVFAALRELFARLCERHPTALVIDDLQWADADSLALLADLREPPDAPPLLVLATARAVRDSSLAGAWGAAFAEARSLQVSRLGPDDALRLAHALAETHGEKLADEDAQGVARESGGHPLFIDELVRHVVHPHDDMQPGGRASLDAALFARAQRLDDDARRLLELCAVAGAPLDEDTAARALALPPAEVSRHASLLRASSLVASVPGPGGLEPYHDRVREAIVGRLSPEAARTLHARLAEAISAGPDPDPERLFAHHRGAGDKVRAATFAALGAERASRALAFSRAARLYQHALELAPEDAAAVSWRVKLGDALSCMGRSGDAALVYLEAAKSLGREESLELMRRAAEKLLVSGHVDEGIAGMRTVLQSVGLKLAETPRRALLSLLLRRARLKLRGLRFRPREERQVPREDLRHIDTCWSVGIGLGMVDPIRSMDFQTRHLLLALEAGEPYRLARALTLEATFRATAGEPVRADVLHLFEEAERLARQIQHPHALGLVELGRGVSAFLTGRFREARDTLAEAGVILREQCVNVSWEINTCEQFTLLALTKLGELGEAQRRMPLLRKSARERGDLFASYILRGGLLCLVALASDEPDRARAEIVEGIAKWSQVGFQLQHYWELAGQVQCDLYVGDGRGALDRIVARWDALESSMVLRVQHLFVDAMQLKGRAHLAAAMRLLSHDPERERLLKVADRCADRIERSNVLPREAPALILRAGVTAARGRANEAAELCARGAEAADRTNMSLLSAVCRQRRAELVGGDEAYVLSQQVSEYMERQRIKSPRRMVKLFAPGFAD